MRQKAESTLKCMELEAFKSGALSARCCVELHPDKALFVCIFIKLIFGDKERLRKV